MRDEERSPKWRPVLHNVQGVVAEKGLAERETLVEY